MAASEEYALVRRQVGLLDRTDFGVLELTGRDRASFLHALVSNEIKALGPGQGCAATLLDVHGKVQVLLFVWVADDRIFVVTPPAMAAKTSEALDHYLFSEKVAIEDVSREKALFVLAGPQARATSERLTGARPPENPWSHVVATLGDTPARLLSGGGETGQAGGGVVVADAVIGKVTSAPRSFGLAHPIALAFVRRQHAEPGTRVSVRFAGTTLAAAVSALPFTR